MRADYIPINPGNSAPIVRCLPPICRSSSLSRFATSIIPRNYSLAEEMLTRLLGFVQGATFVRWILAGDIRPPNVADWWRHQVGHDGTTTASPIVSMTVCCPTGIRFRTRQKLSPPKQLFLGKHRPGVCKMCQKCNNSGLTDTEFSSTGFVKSQSTFP